MAKQENKTTSSFNKAIKAMLDKRAASDPLFAEAYKREGKSIEECCNYIINEVRRMKVNALTDEEVLGLAVHYYDEVDIKVSKAPACQVVVPATPECELNDGANKALQVYNTNGREVLLVWFERIYDKGQGPQVRKL